MGIVGRALEVPADEGLRKDVHPWWISV
jgi:hypothetical protein